MDIVGSATNKDCIAIPYIPYCGDISIVKRKLFVWLFIAPTCHSIQLPLITSINLDRELPVSLYVRPTADTYKYIDNHRIYPADRPEETAANIFLGVYWNADKTAFRDDYGTLYELPLGVLEVPDRPGDSGLSCTVSSPMGQVVSQDISFYVSVNGGAPFWEGVNCLKGPHWKGRDDIRIHNIRFLGMVKSPAQAFARNPYRFTVNVTANGQNYVYDGGIVAPQGVYGIIAGRHLVTDSVVNVRTYTGSYQANTRIISNAQSFKIDDNLCSLKVVTDMGDVPAGGVVLKGSAHQGIENTYSLILKGQLDSPGSRQCSVRIIGTYD